MKFELFQALVQSAELERGEELAHLVVVPGLKAKGVRVDIERHIIKKLSELLIDAHLLRALLDGVA